MKAESVRVRGALWLFVTVAVVLLDQVTKAMARSSLTPGEPVPLLDGILQLNLAHNTGASFGLFQGMRGLIVLFSVVALGVFIYFLLVRPPASKLLLAAIATAGGGVIGNLIDRVWFGQVTDFIDVMIWPVFNVADMAITCGVGLIIIQIARGKAEESSARPGNNDTGGEPS